ncbi:MAG: hypothetical protein V3U23_02930 [Kiloniellales bacterium]
MPRVRDLGIYQSALPTGPHNAITDVPGVAVGHCTVIEGAGAFTGHGPYRHGLPVERVAALVRKSTESDCARMP